MVITPEGDRYVAQCLEVDVSSFGDTQDEALAMVTEALELWAEDTPDRAAQRSLTPCTIPRTLGVNLPPRPRHQDKDIENVLRSAEQQGWRVKKGRTYFRLRCPCGRHQKWVHVTPSGSNYLKNLLALLNRSTCFEERP